jgi:shikimate dehydrogenase
MKTYGLIGKELSHSFSQHYFEQKFNRENIEDSCYQNFELKNINLFTEFIKKNTLSGLNVTIPYKQSILPFLDSLSEEAFEIGAVNTIVVKEGKLIGHNTDHIGFRNALKPFLDRTMERALILGTGGASKAVKYALENIGIDCLLVSRTPDEQQISYTELNQYVLKHHLLVVNTTPL